MKTSYHMVFLLLSSLTLLMSETLRYWDLGVHIDKNSQTMVQKELSFDQIADIHASSSNEEQIMAFRANNFIAPILHNLKYPTVGLESVVLHKDKFIFSLSTGETINFIKRSFLNDNFSRFFTLYGQIKINEVPRIEQINILYIQNLYRSNQYNNAKKILNSISLDDMTDEMVLYLIKTNIKLGNIEESLEQIKFFNKKFNNSDLARYVNHEKKLLNQKYEK
tara:strand:+ start:1237 stop:1902 length:666 start_codon:yes stop_codon:yes gene_type:complete